MANSVTGKIYDGEEPTIQEFLTSCARSMGGLSHMREDGPEAPIRLQTVPEVLYDFLDKAEKQLAAWEGITLEEAEEKVEADYQSALRHYEQRLKEKEELKDRYVQMWNRVNAWEAPKELQSIKEFGLRQLEEAVEMDCAYKQVKPEKTDAKEYLDYRNDFAKKEVARFRKRVKEEEDRVADVNEWIMLLRKSLEGIGNEI